MGEHTDNTINRIAKNIWQASLGRRLHTDQERVEVSEADQRKQLEDLLSTICERFFKQFIELQAAFTSRDEEKIQAIQNTQKGLRDTLDESILNYLNPPDKQDVVSILITRFSKNTQPDMPFPTFVDTLKMVFSGEEIYTKKILHKEICTVVACIARAIQDVTFIILQRYYYDIKPVLEADKKALRACLKRS